MIFGRALLNIDMTSSDLEIILTLHTDLWVILTFDDLHFFWPWNAPLYFRFPRIFLIKYEFFYSVSSIFDSLFTWINFFFSQTNTFISYPFPLKNELSSRTIEQHAKLRDKLKVRNRKRKSFILIQRWKFQMEFVRRTDILFIDLVRKIFYLHFLFDPPVLL